MPDIRVVTLLVALVPCAVLAQPAATDSPQLPPLVSAPEEPVPDPAWVPEQAVESKPVERPYSVSPGRTVVELLAGGAGGVAGTFMGLFAGEAVGADQWDCSGDVCRGRPLGASAILGSAMGSMAGVYLAGTVLDGRGRFLPTLAAGLVTGSLSAGLYYAGIRDSAEVVIPLMALPLVASIVTYEVSAAMLPASPHGGTTSRTPAATWTPTVALTSGGGALGLAGRF